MQAPESLGQMLCSIFFVILNSIRAELVVSSIPMAVPLINKLAASSKKVGPVKKGPRLNGKKEKSGKN